MEWREFVALLSGIMPKTPLGMIVQIRSEEDKDILKHYTKEQHQIRNAWRSRHDPAKDMSESEKKAAVKKLQEVFARAFS